MDRGAWRAAVRGVSWLSTHAWGWREMGCSNKLVLLSTAKSLQSCPTLCDPIDGSPPGSPVPGVLQAGTLEWVAISFSNAWKWSCSVVQLLATPWTAVYQAPPSMGFSRQEYWSGVPLPSPIKLVELEKKKKKKKPDDFLLVCFIWFFFNKTSMFILRNQCFI